MVVIGAAMSQNQLRPIQSYSGGHVDRHATALSRKRSSWCGYCQVVSINLACVEREQSMNFDCDCPNHGLLTLELAGPTRVYEQPRGSNDTKSIRRSSYMGRPSADYAQRRDL